MGKINQVIFDHTVFPTSAAIPAPPPVAQNFMPNWPNGQAVSCIGSYDSVLVTNKDRTGRCDLGLIQPRYWSQTVIEDYYTLLGAISSDYIYHKNILAMAPFKVPVTDFTDAPDALQNAREITSSLNALDTWQLFYIDGISSKRCGDYVDSGWGVNYMLNPLINYVPEYENKSFPSHYAEYYNTRLFMDWDQNKDARNYVDGIFWAQSNLRSPPKQNTTGNELLYADWDVDGTNESDADAVWGGVWWREQLNTWRSIFNDEIGSDRAIFTDATPDFEDFLSGRVPNVWPQPEWSFAWDGRIADQLFKTSLGFEKVASGYYIAATYSSFNFGRAVEFNRGFLKVGSSANLGYGVVIAGHEVHEPTSDMEWAALRAMKAASLISPNVIYAPKVDEHTPAPHLDESTAQIGNPVGVWQGYGLVLDPAGAYLAREADYSVPGASGQGVLFQQFSRHLAVFNNHQPAAVGTVWDHTALDVIPLPDPGTGRAWAYLDVTSGSNVNSAGLGMLAQDTNFNDGSYCSSVNHQYGEVNLPRPGGALLRRLNAPVNSESPPPTSDWQADNWPFMAVAGCVADQPRVTAIWEIYSGSNLPEWAARHDAVLLQNRFWVDHTSPNVWSSETNWKSMQNLIAINPNVRIMFYLYPLGGASPGFGQLGWANIAIQSMYWWWCRDVNGNMLYDEGYSSLPDDLRPVVNNFEINYQEGLIDRNAQGRTYGEQYWYDYTTKAASDSTMDWLALPNFAGFFLDATDPKDEDPRTVLADLTTRVYQRDQDGTGTYNLRDNRTTISFKDYGDAEDSGLVRYHKSLNLWREQTRAAVNTVTNGSYQDCAIAYNGGRTGEYSNDAYPNWYKKATDEPWCNQTDWILFEHSNVKWGIAFNPARNGYIYKYSGYSDTEFLKRLAACWVQVSTGSNSRLGQNFVHLHQTSDIGANPSEVSDVPQETWEWSRHQLYAMLHPRIALGALWHHGWPLPRLDESIYDIGAPVGSWYMFTYNGQQSGELFNDAVAFRPHDYPAEEVWQQEFERGWIFFCSKKPATIGNVWPGSDGVTITLPVMSGYNHAMIDCTDTSYVNPKLGFGYYGQSPQINDGSTKTQLYIPRLCGRMTRKVPV